jgi:hypothetical protein
LELVDWGKKREGEKEGGEMERDTEGQGEGGRRCGSE